MEKDNRKVYTAPILTVVSCKVERGYASTINTIMGFLGVTIANASDGQEQWQENNNYYNSGWN